jgi:hypothetical protein
MSGEGSGWLGGGGAREREGSRLGNTQGAGTPLRALVWSERQREGVELEVGCLGVCQSKGKEREIGGTPEADWWGCGVVWVQVHAWRVVERKERGGRGS